MEKIHTSKVICICNDAWQRTTYEKERNRDRGREREREERASSLDGKAESERQLVTPRVSRVETSGLDESTKLVKIHKSLARCLSASSFPRETRKEKEKEEERERV